jgi:uncharacterized protein (DUF433 family)
MAEYQSIITINPQICSGKPTIRGMRMSVYDILEMLANKMSFTDIIRFSRTYRRGHTRGIVVCGGRTT